MSDFEVRRIAWRESCQASFAVDTEDVEGATAKALLGSLCSCWMEHFLGCAPCRRPSGCKRQLTRSGSLPRKRHFAMSFA